MAQLNQQEREALRNELLGMSYNAAKSRVSRLDPNARLRYWRNAQYTGEWHTRFDLPGLGTSVTLVETVHDRPESDQRFLRRHWEYVDARVEPLNDNHS